MSVLKDELTVVIGADISPFKQGVNEVKTEVRGVYGEVLKTGDAGQKAGEKAAKGFKQWRSELLFVKANVLLVGAAVAALATPFLQAEDAILELDAAAKLSGKSVKDIGDEAGKMAAKAGVSVATFADSAKKSMASFAGDSKLAMAATEAAIRGASLELYTQEEALAALGPLAKKFAIGANEIEGALSLLTASSMSTQTSIGELSGVLVSLAPFAKRSGTDLLELASSIVFLDKKGIQGSDAVEAITAALKQLGKETPFDNIDQWEAYYSGLSATASSADSLGATLEILFDQAQAGNTALVASVTGSEDLAQAFRDGAEGGISFASALASVNEKIAAMPALIDEAKSKLDKMAEAAASLARSLSGHGEGTGNFANVKNMMGFFGMDFFGFATGGSIPGYGTGDSVPAMLTPGEFVIRKEVAQKMEPFLRMLNAGGLDPSTLWNTRVGTRRVGGANLLDILGIPQKHGISSGFVNVHDPTISFKQAQLSQISFGMLKELQGFARGGPVSNPGPTHSTSISGGVNINVTGQAFTQAMVRRQFKPMLDREIGGARSNYSRSRR